METRRPMISEITHVHGPHHAELLEPRIVLDGDWSAFEDAGVYPSLADGRYISVTTIDLEKSPIVFEQADADGDDGSLEWESVGLLRVDDGTSNGVNFDTQTRHSIAVAGDRLLVGAPNANFGSGAVAVYRMDLTGQWAFESTITVPGLEAGDGFGWSVDIHGNTAVIGTKSGNAAYVFRDQGAWTLEATLEGTTDQAAGRFGFSVATDGSVIAVGAPGEELLDDDATRTSGAVYIFERDGNNWTLATRLDAPESAINSEFGNAVATHGSTVIVGAWLDDDMGEDSGSVFALGRHGQDWLVEEKLTLGTVSPGARFGYDVDAGGSRAVAIAIGADDGSTLPSAHVFKRNGESWSREAMLGAEGVDHGWRSVAFHGDRVVLGSDADGGQAQVYSRQGATDDWTLETTLLPSDIDQEDLEAVGFDVAVHDRTVVLGGLIAPGLDGDEPVAVNAAAWVFRSPAADDGPADGDLKWIVRDLGELPGVSGDTLSDIVTWTDVKDGQTYAAVATTNGLILFTRSADRSEWTVRNLTQEIAGAENIVSDISVFGERGNRVLIVGYNDENELVIYRQPNTGEPGNWDWDFANITERDLRPQGLETPQFVSPISTFATRWNALNIAGIDANGNIQAVWIGPGMERWRVSDLSANAGTPDLRGNLASFVTSWGAINFAGVNETGELVVTWWVPGFERWVVSDFNALFGGPELEEDSVTAYTTQWGALNIVGRDARGDLIVYWWVPQFADEPSTDRWHITNISTEVNEAEPTASELRGLVTDEGQINLFGTNAINDVIRFFWEPGDRWRMENLTHTAEPA